MAFHEPVNITAINPVEHPVEFARDLIFNKMILRYDIHEGHSNRLMALYTFELPFTAVVLYLAMVFFGPKLTAGGKPRKFPWIMQFWNLGLSIFSLCIVLGTAIPWLKRLATEGLFVTVCDPNKELYQGATPLLYWSYVFALSKFVELFDTFWTILRNPGEPIMFLHWYHHTTVLLFTWFAEYYRFSVGFIFVFVNALVHTFMYFYYFLTTRGHRPSWAIFLTIGQISQMVLGIAACSYWGYLYSQGISCGCDNPELIMYSCVFMYGSYLLLFLKFFYERYLAPKKPAAASSSKKAKGKKTEAPAAPAAKKAKAKKTE
eukprot:TRINITY_DN2325_c0_g1_i1.p1 TRINITY_DN2325_c0_g1~~TRINITY_DN2325_c0_g1_i1.p1  ORF type:complete len:331 (-),score=49.70 TRINITY_DN2325_c0_g1_i1:55-1008(-)